MRKLFGNGDCIFASFFRYALLTRLMIWTFRSVRSMCFFAIILLVLRLQRVHDDWWSTWNEMDAHDLQFRGAPAWFSNSRTKSDEKSGGEVPLRSASLLLQSLSADQPRAAVSHAARHLLALDCEADQYGEISSTIRAAARWLTDPGLNKLGSVHSAAQAAAMRATVCGGTPEWISAGQRLLNSWLNSAGSYDGTSGGARYDVLTSRVSLEAANALVAAELAHSDRSQTLELIPPASCERSGSLPEPTERVILEHLVSKGRSLEALERLIQFRNIHGAPATPSTVMTVLIGLVEEGHTELAHQLGRRVLCAEFGDLVPDLEYTLGKFLARPQQSHTSMDNQGLH